MGIRCADHVTSVYPQKKLALTEPTGGGRSVGIVRSQTKATEFSFSLVLLTIILPQDPFRTKVSSLWRCNALWAASLTFSGFLNFILDLYSGADKSLARPD